MVFLSVTASLLKSRKFFCPTKQFSKNLCAREQCPPCAHVTQMERRTDIYTIPKLNEEEDNRKKIKDLNMLPVIGKIHEYTLVAALFFY